MLSKVLNFKKNLYDWLWVRDKPPRVINLHFKTIE